MANYTAITKAIASKDWQALQRAIQGGGSADWSQWTTAMQGAGAEGLTHPYGTIDKEWTFPTGSTDRWTLAGNVSNQLWGPGAASTTPPPMGGPPQPGSPNAPPTGQGGAMLSGLNPQITAMFRHLFTPEQIQSYALKQPFTEVNPQVTDKGTDWKVGNFKWWENPAPPIDWKTVASGVYGAKS